MTTNTTDSKNCIFCKIVKKEIPAQFVFEDKSVVAFLDISPVNAGHTLVVPREHHADVLDTPDAVLNDMMTHAKRIAKAVMAATKSDGFNIGINTKAAAGQVIFHTHLHIIPRLSTDGLKHWPHQKLDAVKMASVQDSIKTLLK